MYRQKPNGQYKNYETPSDEFQGQDNSYAEENSLQAKLKTFHCLMKSLQLKIRKRDENCTKK